MDRQDKASYEDLSTSTWADKGPGMGQEGRSTSSKETQGHSYPRAPRTTCLGWDSLTHCKMNVRIVSVSP